jgi:predicted transcriptional regulator
MFELNPEFVEKLHLSTHISVLLPIFTLLLLHFTLNLQKRSGDFFDITEPVIQRFKKDYREELCAFLNLENAEYLPSHDARIADLQ